jgi:formylmethanofuran dehydrogenase subunit E
MQHVVQKSLLKPGDEQVLSIRCSQCGSAIQNGRELVVNDKQMFCEGCYRWMVNPDSGGDIPSKWF